MATGQKKKYTYTIFDAPNLASASQVAAGFINPVTGKWMTESWKIDTLMPKAKAFYQDIEQSLGINIYHELPIRRYFINPEDAIRARRRIKNPRYANYFDPILEKGSEPIGIIDDFGSIPIRHGSWVNVPSLMKNLKATLNLKTDLLKIHLMQASWYKKEPAGTTKVLRQTILFSAKELIQETTPFLKTYPSYRSKAMF